MANRKTYEEASYVEERGNTILLTHSTAVAIKESLTCGYQTMWNWGSRWSPETAA
jgi:hypothetical protein